MRIRLISVPYDSGHFRGRMGAGPEHLLKHGLKDRLREAGHVPVAASVHSAAAFQAENETAFELMGAIAAEVARATADGELPIVLAGHGGGKIETGRHLRLGSDTPMSNLFLSMLDRMGVAEESFGDATGRLAGI